MWRDGGERYQSYLTLDGGVTGSMVQRLRLLINRGIVSPDRSEIVNLLTRSPHLILTSAIRELLRLYFSLTLLWSSLLYHQSFHISFSQSSEFFFHLLHSLTLCYSPRLHRHFSIRTNGLHHSFLLELSKNNNNNNKNLVPRTFFVCTCGPSLKH